MSQVVSVVGTALAEGVPISEVSRWLGHKSITTTVDLYGHLVPEASGRAALIGFLICAWEMEPQTRAQVEARMRQFSQARNN